jgi:hypothetical protein
LIHSLRQVVSEQKPCHAKAQRTFAPLRENQCENPRAEAEQGRFASAQELLFNTMPLIEKLETSPETLKNFAVAFAEAGNIRAALQGASTINAPHFTTQALIDIGTLCAKRKLRLDDGDLAVLSEVVKVGRSSNLGLAEW